MERNDRALTAFAMLGHATFHAYELAIPIFVVFWLEVYSTTAAWLGVIVGVSYALVGLGALPSGVLADTVGSRRLVIACMLGMGGAFALVSVAPNVFVLTAGLLVWGAAASIYHPAGLALLSRGAHQRGAAFAYHGMAGNVGVALGPLLATVLLAFVGWRSAAILLVVPVLLAALLATRFEFDETAGSVSRGAVEGDGRGPPRDLKMFLRDTKHLFAGGFVLVFAVGVLYGVYYRGAFTFLPGILSDLALFEPVVLFDRTFEPSRYIYSGLLLLGGVGQYAGGRLVDRVRTEYALVGGYLALAGVALTLIPAANAGLAPLLAVAGLFGFLVFAIAPVNQEAISAYSPADVRGLSFGFTYMAIFGVGALGATLAGVVLTRSTPDLLFTLLAGVAAVAVLVSGSLLLRS